MTSRGGLKAWFESTLKTDLSVSMGTYKTELRESGDWFYPGYMTFAGLPIALDAGKS